MIRHRPVRAAALIGIVLAVTAIAGCAGFTALVPAVSSIAVWQRTGGSWHRTQVINVDSAPAGQSS